MTDNAPIPAPEEERVEKLTLVKLFTGVVLRPKETFTHLRDNGNSYWWVVFLTIFGLSAITSIISLIQQSKRIAAMAAMAAETGIEISTGTQITGTLISLAFSAASIILGFLFTALVLYGMSFVLGGKTRFKSLFRMTAWASLPYAVRNLMQLLVTLLAGRSVRAGMSGVMTTAESMNSPIVSALLAKFDAYMLWALFLLVIGVMVTARLDLKKSLIAVGAYMLISIGVIIGYTAIAQKISETLGTSFNLPGVSTGGGMQPGGGGVPPSGGGEPPSGDGMPPSGG